MVVAGVIMEDTVGAITEVVVVEGTGGVTCCCCLGSSTQASEADIVPASNRTARLLV
jgi:hypothetical protein